MGRKSKGFSFTGKFLNDDKPETGPAKRYNAQCEDCKTYFFGATQKEADNRELKHNCPK